MTNRTTALPRTAAPRRRRLLYALLLSVVLGPTGCATSEHRYTIRDLPDELQADAWHSPSLTDLSRAARPAGPRGIEPGDTVEIVLLDPPGEAAAASFAATVDEHGGAALPGIGRVELARAAGRQPDGLVVPAADEGGERLASRMHVTVREPRRNRITVLGAVVSPGQHELPRDACDLASAVAAAKGLARDAEGTIVIQRRAAPERPPAALADLQLAGHEVDPPRAQGTDTGDSGTTRQEIRLDPASSAAMPAVALADGDVLHVRRGAVPSVLVAGMVEKPGRYEFPIGRDFRLLDAIGSAQGVSKRIVDTVIVSRRVPRQDERALIEVSLHEATRSEKANLRLQPDDIISVEANPESLGKDTLQVGKLALGVGVRVATP